MQQTITSFANSPTNNLVLFVQGEHHVTLEKARRFQDLLVPGVSDEQFSFETIFSDTGYSARSASRLKFKMLKRIAPKVRRMLRPDEKVLLLMRGRRYHSLWDYYLFGAALSFLSRRAVIYTNRRIILLQLENFFRPGELIEQVDYSAISQVSTSTWHRVTVGLGSGQRIQLGNVSAQDVGLLARLLDESRAIIARAERGVENLCHYCYEPVAGHPTECVSCGGTFKSARKAAILSLIFPGIGDWYLGHHVHSAIELAAAALGWMVIVNMHIRWQSPMPEFLGTCAGFFFVMHCGDAYVTRRFARMGLHPTVSEPLGALGSVRKFASVIGVFVLAVIGVILKDYADYRTEQVRTAHSEEQARLSDPRIQQMRADQAARVEQISVTELAQRIAAHNGQLSVVVLYQVCGCSPPSEEMFPQLVALQKQYANQGVQFELYSVDYDEDLPDIPVYLAKHQAGFAPARVRRWPKGELSRSMTSVGINVGASWSVPLVALLDRNRAVIWQGQGVDNLNELQSLLADHVSAQN